MSAQLEPTPSAGQNVPTPSLAPREAQAIAEEIYLYLRHQDPEHRAEAEVTQAMVRQ